MDKKVTNPVPDDLAPLADQIKALAIKGQGTEALKECVLKGLKPAFQAGRKDIERDVKSRKIKGLEAAHLLSDAMDQTIRDLCILTTESVFLPGNRTSSENISIVATGGYGRGQLAFYSDIDIMFLIPYKAGPWVENVTEFMLQVLWDLGLKVGYSLRTIDECIQISRQDLSVRTAVLDARFLAGDEALFQKTWKRFQKEVISGNEKSFVEGRLAERDARHAKLGDSRYVVEPNLKEGKGGLRDLHTLYWIGRFLYGVDDIAGLVKKKVLRSDEAALFHRAENFLWTVRQALHLLAGHGEERLTFDMQLALAKELGYRDRPNLSAIERFMKHYYYTAKAVGDLTRIFCAILEARHQKKRLIDWKVFSKRPKVEDFRLEDGRLGFSDVKRVQKNPVQMLQIFSVADKNGYDIHPDALRLITRNRRLIDNRLRRDPEANDIFMEILTSRHDPETGLRRMNEAGVLGRFITDFGRIVAHTQHDMYHSYTVDEHTIRAIGLLSQIEKGELSDIQTLGSDVAGGITSRAVLYLSLFLHDIAKGRGGNHSILGEKIAHSLGPRLGLTPGEVEQVAWLVRNHLLMSSVAFKFDIADPKTVKDFTDQVSTLDRLRLLTVLTIADIMAVGPKTWTSWKHRLLSDLYNVSKPLLAGETSEKAFAAMAREKQAALKKALKGWSPKQFKEITSLLPTSYWLGDRTDIQANEAGLLAKAAARKGKVAVGITPHKETNVIRISAVSKEDPAIFSKLAGAMASRSLNIADARSYTLKDGRLLNSFVVAPPAGDSGWDPQWKKDLTKFLLPLVENPSQDIRLPERKSLLKNQVSYFTVEPRISFDNEVSTAYTVLEVNARDRIGLLYDLTKVLVGHGCAIFSAHVATYGERAVDVFYIQDKKGEKILNKKSHSKLADALLEAVG